MRDTAVKHMFFIIIYIILQYINKRHERTENRDNMQVERWRKLRAAYIINTSVNKKNIRVLITFLSQERVFRKSFILRVVRYIIKKITCQNVFFIYTSYEYHKNNISKSHMFVNIINKI